MPAWTGLGGEITGEVDEDGSRDVTLLIGGDAVGGIGQGPSDVT